MYTPGTRASARGLGPLRLAVLLVCCGGLLLAHAEATRVALYMSASNGVLDLSWDNGPQNLERQLQQLGFDVRSSDGQPTLSGPDAPAAYIIPAQNGPSFYSSVEDMNAISSYLSSGGLVVVLDANHGQGEALRSFVEESLGYQGSWSTCKQLSANAEKQLALTEFASSFVSVKEWPESLENAQTTSLLSWCRHEDSSASIVPLYTSIGDESQVAVQAFGKVSVPGAVVWMGYSWKDGEQEQWGLLLKKLVEEFAQGGYEAPKQGNADLHPFNVDSVLAAAADVGATYPPPPPKSESTKISVVNMTAYGAAGKTRDLVWYDDADFREQLKPLSALQLVDQTKTPCPAKCGACELAWKATRSNLQVAVFFRDPVQIARIYLKQIKNSGIITIQFIKWVYPPTGAIAGNVGRTVWNVTDDTSMCQSVLVVRVPPKKSGVNKPVPTGFNRRSLPPSLASTAVGGVLITMERPDNAGQNFGPFLEWVRFSGRVLYPENAAIYANAVRKK
ncbi:hypothetical protein VOLCADRAFT_107521 [Volvox carteri f. nagariensis]|uniref:DUF4350 domain-containing protein n=1 Tax=Volvox carteri f. nagariensis TaxID=3068 RepID=D8UEL3_VOLCA|nr:uncharacterized protein VOLCADRAFT_107521 [Volvox carteri f. nagariensis]EFJ41864.1 hypothetical protein VOLCADRAFT_107521 [Volvox carteri f. nagariensis]|eukprot:XP_002957062.1 hypothetical protein VOLCADRAFT_107521 [Volvox carteri f. nagariensis]